MENLQFLERYLGKSSRAANENYMFYCPFCRHHKPKLGVSLANGMWNCWVCKTRGRSILKLLSYFRLDADAIALAQTYFRSKKFSQNETERKNKPFLQLPKEFKRLSDSETSREKTRVINYLQSRNITMSDIIRHDIGFCESGQYSEMLIFPNYNEFGELTYFSGRSYNVLKPKFIAPNIDKDFVPDENLICWEEPIILVESKLDAITIRRNALPIYGKIVSKSLQTKILESSPPEVNICLDGDASSSVYQVAEIFVKNGIIVKQTNLPFEHDANSLGFDKIWQYILAAKPIQQTNLFHNLILSKFN